ncbi:hypothetical protein DAPPUDRAFT_276730, partial [Daphnia pulex]
MLTISWSAAGWSPLSLTMTALVGLLAGYYWVWSRSRFVRLINALPGPKPLPLLGNILQLANFSLDDDAWRKRRRMLNPAFSFQILNGFIGTFNDLSLDCVAKLEEMLEAVQHKEMDLVPIIHEHIFVKRFMHQPWLRSDFIFKLSPLYRLEKRCISNTRSLIDKVIQNRHEQQKKNGQSLVFNNNEKEEDEYNRP